MEKLKSLRNNFVLLLGVCLIACTLTAAIPPAVTKISDPFQGRWLVSESDFQSASFEIIISGQYASVISHYYRCGEALLVSKAKYNRSGDSLTFGGDSYVKTVRLLPTGQLEAEMISYNKKVTRAPLVRTIGDNPLNKFPLYLFWP